MSESFLARACRGEFWWESWTAGVGLTLAGWFLHVATVIEFGDDAGSDELSMMALSLSLPVLSAALIPAFYTLTGLALCLERLRGDAGLPAGTLCRAEAFAISFVLSGILFALSQGSVGDAVSGILIGCIMAQGTFGLYVPFTLALIANHLTTKAKRTGTTAALAVMATLCYGISAVIGLALGNA